MMRSFDVTYVPSDDSRSMPLSVITEPGGITPEDLVLIQVQSGWGFLPRRDTRAARTPRAMRLFVADATNNLELLLQEESFKALGGEYRWLIWGRFTANINA